MKCLGLDEAATRLAVQPSTLRRWARDGKVESVRLGRRLVFREAALDAFIQTGIRNPKGIRGDRPRA
jgi:excisionase family DNA binding protein